MLNVQSGAAGVRVAESHFGLVCLFCTALSHLPSCLAVCPM